MFCLSSVVPGFVWPGVAPREYRDGESVPMLANKLSSVRTQIPRSFYALPGCVPHQLTRAPESLGEVMNGNLVQNAPFELRFGLSRELVLCKVDLDHHSRLLWAKRVREDYRAHLLLDNLPVATRLSDSLGPMRYERGYTLGVVRQPGVHRLGRTGTAYCHNHLAFSVGYFDSTESQGASSSSSSSGGGFRIVSFEVVPHSRRYSYAKRWPESFEGKDGEAKDPINLTPEDVGLRAVGMPLSLDDPATVELIFTYNVSWHQTDIPYASRWDLYMYLEEGQHIHWFSLTGSLAISLVLATLVGGITMRTVRRDLQRYNADEGDFPDFEIGWKYCHADVLRPPQRPLLLAACVGSGVQLTCMVLVSLLLSLLGFLSPTVRGRLLTAALLLYAAAGAPAGYAAARLYRQMHGRQMYELVALTVGLFPGVFLLLFLLLDLVLWANESSSAVPGSTMLLLLLLFGGLHSPLVILGARAGLRAPRTEDVVYTNAIPRQIPHQPSWQHWLPTALLGGLMPFGSGCVELGIVLSSVWTQRLYFVFSFLLLMACLMAVICAEVAIVLCYFQLRREDYRWWWRSFLNTATTGLYFLAYALYYSAELQLSGGVSRVLYFGYMSAAALSLGLMTGTIGLGAAYLFVVNVYAKIRVD